MVMLLKMMVMMIMMMMMMLGMRKHLVEAAIRWNDAAAPTITSYTSVMAYNAKQHFDHHDHDH